jgi:hypothetical protein
MRPIISLVDVACSERGNWEATLQAQIQEICAAGDRDTALPPHLLPQSDLVLRHEPSLNISSRHPPKNVNSTSTSARRSPASSPSAHASLTRTPALPSCSATKREEQTSSRNEFWARALDKIEKEKV